MILGNTWHAGKFIPTSELSYLSGIGVREAKHAQNRREVHDNTHSDKCHCSTCHRRHNGSFPPYSIQGTVRDRKPFESRRGGPARRARLQPPVWTSSLLKRISHEAGERVRKKGSDLEILVHNEIDQHDPDISSILHNLHSLNRSIISGYSLRMEKCCLGHHIR